MPARTLATATVMPPKQMSAATTASPLNRLRLRCSSSCAELRWGAHSECRSRSGAKGLISICSANPLISCPVRNREVRSGATLRFHIRARPMPFSPARTLKPLNIQVGGAYCLHFLQEEVSEVLRVSVTLREGAHWSGHSERRSACFSGAENMK